MFLRLDLLELMQVLRTICLLVRSVLTSVHSASSFLVQHINSLTKLSATSTTKGLDRTQEVLVNLNMKQNTVAYRLCTHTVPAVKCYVTLISRKRVRL